MHKPNVKNLVKIINHGISKRRPEILTGIGIAGMITTSILAVKATPKALQLIETKQIENINTKNRYVEDKETGEVFLAPLTLTETVKAAWTPYIPAVVTGAFSVACIVGASSVNARRNAALATAYKLSETAFAEYKDKVVETIGEKKEKTVRDKVAKERIERDPVKNHEVIITEKGETLCYDYLSGRYFQSDIEKIRRAENDLNNNLMNEMYVSLNEFYYYLGLSAIGIGNDVGWNVEDGLINVEFSSQLTDDGKPCLVVGYRVAPRHDFARLM